MVVHATLSEVRATEGRVPELPAYVKGPDPDAVITDNGWLDENGDFHPDNARPAIVTGKVSAVEDVVNGVYTKYTLEYVDKAGNVKAVGSPARNYVRYAEYPGQRLFSKVAFDVSGKNWVAAESMCACSA